MYHGISSRAITFEVFKEHINYIKKHFNCFWVSEIPDLINRLPGDKPALVLTFDDGLKNNFDVVAPFLEKEKIKATFYVTSGLLNGGKMLWNHEILCLLTLIRNENLPSWVREFSDNEQMRWNETNAFLEEIKGWEKGKRLGLLLELRNIMPEPKFYEWMKEEYILMDKRNVQSLPDVIEIGSHSSTHPILSKLSDEEARNEIENSKHEISSIIGKDIDSFCYPDGKYLERDINLVRSYYKTAVTVDEGFAGNNMFVLKRIPAANNFVDFVFRLLKPNS